MRVARLGASTTEPREARAVRWPDRWVLAMPLLAAFAGCMPRTDVMRALLEQSEGVDNELATEYQERPVHLQSAQPIWTSRVGLAPASRLRGRQELRRARFGAPPNNGLRCLLIYQVKQQSGPY